jgi:hypothetical protein
MVVIHQVQNGNHDETTSMQLQGLNRDVRNREELIDFIKQNCNPDEPYCQPMMYKSNLTQEELDEKYMELYSPGQTMNDPLYGHISSNSSLSNTFQLNLGHDVKLLLVEMKAVTGKDIVEHVIRPANVFPASLRTVRYALLLITIFRLWGYPMKMKQWWMRWQLGKRLTVVLM